MKVVVANRTECPLLALSGHPCEGLGNVCFWLLADILDYVELCPLLGVKRTFPTTVQPMPIYEYTA